MINDFDDSLSTFGTNIQIARQESVTAPVSVAAPVSSTAISSVTPKFPIELIYRNEKVEIVAVYRVDGWVRNLLNVYKRLIIYQWHKNFQFYWDFTDPKVERSISLYGPFAKIEDAYQHMIQFYKFDKNRITRED